MRIIPLILSCCIISCTTTNQFHPPDPPSESGLGKPPNEPKILFCTFKFIHKTPRDSVFFYSSKIVDGYLKQDIEPKPTLAPNELKYSFLDADQNVIKSTAIDYPLNKKIEYTDESDNEKLISKTIELQENTLTIRTRYDSRINYILLEKTNNNTNPGQIYLFKIPTN